ncbi:MAG: ShlB/FhaC/HecB family hemolysin secretion/activation protein [Richelia sp. CSU_2_1]|nr:ShlB/FhaC/HecB family hemolysin secretion/activation protein [Richelia sp. CSU_2_1]
MPLQLFRGSLTIELVRALALCSSVAAVGTAPLAAFGVTDFQAVSSGPIAPEARYLNVDNLNSKLNRGAGGEVSAIYNGCPEPVGCSKLNREISAPSDRSDANLYLDAAFNTDNIEKKSDRQEFDRAASEILPNIVQLPNPQPNIPNIPVPIPILPTPNPLPEPQPPTPLPPPEQLLQPTTPAPAQPEALPDIPDTVTVDRFEVVGSTVFSKEELDAALKDFVNRPLTFAELLQARSAVNQLYLSKGYITSGALIPPQILAGGTVRILVLEGRLEGIDVTGTKRLNPNYVRSRLALATRGPVNERRLLEALQLLQLGGLLQNITAELQAGSRPGFNLLSVRVREAKTFQAGIFTDNSRSPSVGSWRRGIQAGEANLSGLGDSASLIYTNTEGSNTVDFSYALPVNSRNGTVSFGLSRTRSNIIEPPFDALDIQAAGRTYELSYRQPVVQTPRREIAIGISAARRESDTSLLGEDFPLSPGADSRGRTRVSVLRLFQDFTRRDERQVLAGRSQFSLGVGAFGATQNSRGPDSQFLAWRGQLQYVRLLAPETLLVLRSDLQLAGKELLPIEQFGLGGSDTVRGYRQDVLLADSGIFASAELRYPIWRTGDKQGVLQVTPFVDAGSVWNRGGKGNLETNSLLSAGLGLRWQYADSWSARLGWGIPLIDIKSSDRTWQERGLYFLVEFKP